MNKPIKYGILGYPLGHSFSKPYFEKKFEILGLVPNYEYKTYEIANGQDVEELIKRGYKAENLKGLSVTIPYKRLAYEFVDTLSDEAKKIGAVNCIYFDPQTNQSIGYNTDAIGFEESLKLFLKSGSTNSELINNSLDKPDYTHIKALILGGNGGAGAAVRFVLERMGIDYIIVTRSINKSTDCLYLTYDQLDSHILDKHKLIVNTTPVGMWPHIEDSPLSNVDGIGHNHFIYDLIYNPPITKLMRDCQDRGAKVTNGMAMLELQAEAAWDIWNNERK